MKKKILVVDDEELLIRTMSRFLEKQGYQVYSVKNGQDALAVVESENFDLLICDIRMPGKNGVETTTEIQAVLKSQKKKEIPTIFVTGYADSKIEKEATLLKPAAYLHKPFDIAEIMSCIQRVLPA